MRTRPWPIVILALFYLIAPIGNALLGAWLTRTSPIYYFHLLMLKKTWYELLTFVALFPIAGIAIFAIKKWSYPVFLAVSVTTFYGNYQNWVHYPQVMSLAFLVGLYVFNIALVSYFLLPAVRAPYFNKRLRWWESKPRYLVNLRGDLTGDFGKKKCVITDLSEGGLFLQTTRKLEQGEVITVETQLFHRQVSFLGKVVYFRNSPEKGYGVQFSDQSPENRRALRQLVRGLRLIGVPERNGAPNLAEDFIEWARLVASTGRGLVPTPESAWPRTEKNFAGATAKPPVVELAGDPIVISLASKRKARKAPASRRRTRSAAA
jgi:hypothetical protein